jgi:hypothetical protein
LIVEWSGCSFECRSKFAGAINTLYCAIVSCAICGENQEGMHLRVTSLQN